MFKLLLNIREKQKNTQKQMKRLIKEVICTQNNQKTIGKRTLKMYFAQTKKRRHRRVFN